jgi:hypothetical protein
MSLPYHISELSPRRLAAFKNFLRQSGAEIFSSSARRAMPDGREERKDDARR